MTYILHVIAAANVSKGALKRGQCHPMSRLWTHPWVWRPSRKFWGYALHFLHAVWCFSASNYDEKHRWMLEISSTVTHSVAFLNNYSQLLTFIMILAESAHMYGCFLLSFASDCFQMWEWKCNQVIILSDFRLLFCWLAIFGEFTIS